jgi:hypothetical protein
MREKLLEEWRQLKAEMDAQGVMYGFDFDPKSVPLEMLQAIIGMNRGIYREKTGKIQGNYRESTGNFNEKASKNRCRTDK